MIELFVFLFIIYLITDQLKDTKPLVTFFSIFLSSGLRVGILKSFLISGVEGIFLRDSGLWLSVML